MSEGVVIHIAGKLLEVLGSQVFQEIELAFGVKDEIENLMETVRTIKAVLVDAEQKHSKKNAQVTEWLLRLRDAFYDADDLLDDFLTQLKQREVMTGSKMTKEVRIFLARSNKIACSLKMAHKIKAIREKLENIKKDKEFHLLENRDEKRFENREREQTHSFVREEMVIGRDDDRNEIIKLLHESNDVDNVSVIPIVGMGGLGKTTLAQLVFNDKQVRRHFELRMWVCVSEEFDVKVIVEKIIKSATDKEPEKLEMDQLQKRLHEIIDTRKYLLVLDDIWNEDPVKWTKLKDLLINDVRGSKILVTTRSQKVVEVTNKHSSYVLKGLDDDKSWSLFRQKAFEHGIEPKDSKRLVEIGKEIVAKCVGVPLAISTIGSLLYSNITEDYWLNFKDNELSKIIEEESDILQILKLSYDNLPSYLKRCFAYCALFPKDYRIERQKLIYLWMAQGFIQSSTNNQNLKVVGNNYFMNLLMRSFFHDPEYDNCGNVITCKMHHLMHDLAQLVAGVDCTMATFDRNHNIDRRCRHVSVDCGDVDILNAVLKAKRIRTFLLLDQSYHGCKWIDHQKILSTYSYLRALDLSMFEFEKLSGAIGKLKHLRYLNLSRNQKIKELPNSISKLKNLETLDLSYCRCLQELPRNISKMVNLNDLIIKGCRSLIGMPYGLGSLTNLQNLPMFVVSERNDLDYKKYGALEELCGLKSLRGKLKVTNLQCVDNARWSDYLEKMRFLHSLKLEWDGERKICGSDEVVLEGLKPHPNLKEIKIKYFMGVKLSCWLPSIINLTSITLWNCERCQCIPPLDQLPSLKSLYLWGLDDLEYMSDKASKNCSSTQSTTFFPALQQLTFYNCKKIKGWWKRDSDGATTGMIELPSFPCLSKLNIKFCPNLTSMPLYPSLEELYLRLTSSKPLQQTMMLLNRVRPSTSSSISAPLSNLKSLNIGSIDDLESLPKDGLRNLTSLVDMEIHFCSRLSQLSPGIRFLTFLQNLKIRECEELDLLNDEDDDNMKWQGLRSLRSLHLSGLPKLVSLPKGLQFVTTLQYLQIYNCPNLIALPDYWPNIAHIPNIRIDGKWIQVEGHFRLNSEERSSSLTGFWDR